MGYQPLPPLGRAPLPAYAGRVVGGSSATNNTMAEWRVERIAAALAAVTERIEDGLASLGLDRPIGERGPHMLGVPLPGDAALVTQTLAYLS